MKAASRKNALNWFYNIYNISFSMIRIEKPGSYSQASALGWNHGKRVAQSKWRVQGHTEGLGLMKKRGCSSKLKANELSPLNWGVHQYKTTLGAVLLKPFRTKPSSRRNSAVLPMRRSLLMKSAWPFCNGIERYLLFKTRRQGTQWDVDGRTGPAYY